VRVLGIAQRMTRPEVQARVLRTMARDLAIYQELWGGSEAGELLGRIDAEGLHALADRLDPRPGISDSENRRRKAFHEAGHAVASHLFNAEISDLTLDRDDSERHAIPWFSLQTEASEDAVGFSPMQDLLQRRTQVMLAGEVAQELAGFHSDLGTEADEEVLLESALELGADLDVQAAFVTWMRWSTRQLLASPEQWWKVEGVAEALLERGSMTRDQVQAFLNARVEV